jgi:hypothetical protein
MYLRITFAICMFFLTYMMDIFLHNFQIENNFAHKRHLIFFILVQNVAFPDNESQQREMQRKHRIPKGFQT